MEIDQRTVQLLLRQIGYKKWIGYGKSARLSSKRISTASLLRIESSLLIWGHYSYIRKKARIVTITVQKVYVFFIPYIPSELHFLIICTLNKCFAHYLIYSYAVFQLRLRYYEIKNSRWSLRYQYPIYIQYLILDKSAGGPDYLLKDLCTYNADALQSSFFL